jgi:hypothetical protein
VRAAHPTSKRTTTGAIGARAILGVGYASVLRVSLASVHRNPETVESAVDPMAWECWAFQTLGPLAAKEEALFGDSVFCALCIALTGVCFNLSYPQTSPSDQKDDVEVVQFDVRQSRNREHKLESGYRLAPD